jgi:hypothetical protein
MTSSHRRSLYLSISDNENSLNGKIASSLRLTDAFSAHSVLRNVLFMQPILEKQKSENSVCSFSVGTLSTDHYMSDDEILVCKQKKPTPSNDSRNTAEKRKDSYDAPASYIPYPKTDQRTSTLRISKKDPLSTEFHTPISKHSSMSRVVQRLSSPPKKLRKDPSYLQIRRHSSANFYSSPSYGSKRNSNKNDRSSRSRMRSSPKEKTESLSEFLSRHEERKVRKREVGSLRAVSSP